MNSLMRLTTILLLFASTIAAGKDMITLKNGKTLRCVVTGIAQDVVTVRHHKKTKKFLSSEVSFISLDGLNNEMNELVRTNPLMANPDAKCEVGKADAILYHNRGFGNFCLGFLFGPFGVIGTAIGTPRSPDYVKIPNKENLSDPIYLMCYKKKAKGKNVVAALGGWALVVVLSVALSN